MYWTLELASKLEDAPWPATKDKGIGGWSRLCVHIKYITF